MTASLAAKSLCQGAEMKEAPVQTEIIKAITSACLSADALARAVGQPPSKVGRALSGLVLRGLVERREMGCFSATKAGLELYAQHGFIPRRPPDRTSKPSSRRRGTAIQRAWNVMRIKSPFTVESVGALAANRMAQRCQSLNQWFNALERAGYLRRDKRREFSGSKRGVGRVVYWPTRDTGMLAPIHSRKLDCIRDPNTGEDTPCQR